nr:HupE/UreJ family protein [Aestuariivita boseongensis]
MVFCASIALAHEVTPTIGDFRVQDGRIEMELRLNAEAFVAGIDLDGMADTNDSDQSDVYDDLRALEPEALEPRLRAFMESWLPRIGMDANGPVTLQLDGVTVDPVGNVDLPRPSFLRLSGDLPDGARVMVFTWPDGAGDMVLRQMGVEEPFTGYLEGGQSSDAIPLSGGGARGGWQTFVDYIPVGFDHILPKGLDHILFVLGLFFLSTRLRPLIWQVSAFTLAHTVTLALGALGIVNVPGLVVEPLIAASIVYVAVENLFARGLNPWRPVVIFGFGLLHGLGFASVLGEFGLPAGQFVPALIGFNVGVELGQLTVIALAFLAVGYWFGQKDWYRARIAMPASVVIACVGAYWFVERVFL